MANELLGVQDRITEIFHQKETGVVRVFGVQAAATFSDSCAEKAPMVVGTGFFISCEGHIMTIADIVNKAECIWVEYNGIPCPAELVGFDNITNIAIIRLSHPPSGIPFFHLGESMEIPQPSLILLAITCKLGMDPGPSMGMVTGLHTAFFDRAFPTTYLRSNIPSDGGEGGSPVFDLTGRFVGMMVISIAEIRSSFIIPARAVMRIRDDLVFSGKISYAFLGIEIDKEASMASAPYLIIGKTINGGSAYEAGVKSGDKILEFNGTPITHVMDLHNATFFARPGQLITMKVQREDKELKLTIRLKEQPDFLCSTDTKPEKHNQNNSLVKTDSPVTQDFQRENNEIAPKSNHWLKRLKPE